MALAIAGILAATATPAMQNLVYEQRLTTYVNELFGDLQLARSEAIKRVTQTTLCKSSNGTACSTTSNWQSGWIVFVDSNGNESVDSGETIIKVHQALESGATLRYGSSYGYVYYKSDGTAGPTPRSRSAIHAAQVMPERLSCGPAAGPVPPAKPPMAAR